MYVCIYIYICMYVCMYVCIYIYICIWDKHGGTSVKAVYDIMEYTNSYVTLW